ncbi:MAG: hybrid sensor histidine kinase/response regulator [Opitutales bacterium]
MNLIIVSDIDVIAESIRDQLIDSFSVQETESRYGGDNVSVSILSAKQGLAEKLESANPSVILAQAAHAEDPSLQETLKWAYNSKQSLPVIVISDSVDDQAAVAFISAGVKEIIDLKNYTSRTIQRAILTAKMRAELDYSRQNHERELLESRLAREQASNEKTYFVSMVSHEIRSPLQNIIGFSSLLEETELDDEQREYTSYLNRNALLLSDLVSDVLDHSKIDQGTISLSIEDISPTEAILDAISFVETRALNKKISIQSQLDPSIPCIISGDKLRIIQILKNLLDNAIKFTPEGGSITVSAEWIAPELPEEQGYLECTAEDTGCGIAPERIDHIFAPFAQGEPSRDQSKGGTGLGLALCKRLCQMMKGKILIKKSDEAGTSIQFSLPFSAIEEAKPVKPKEDKKPTDSQQAQEPHANILVVEDDKNSRAYIERFIRYSGLSCDLASDGQEAAEIFRPGQHLLVITDIFMPRVNGVDLCSRLRKIEREGKSDLHCTIFAISAGGGENVRSQILEAGADNFLRKPIRIDQLRQMIRDTLPQKTTSPQ